MGGLRIGVIGCGYWGSKHVRVLQGVTGVERVVAIDSSKERLADVAGAHPSLASSCYRDLEYNAAVWKIRELIELGDLGQLHFLDSARLNLGLYQPDVNVIWDLAPHDVSIFNHLLQATPSHVQAWGGRHAHPFLEDVAHVHLDYACLDLSASIHVSWLDPCKVRRTTVVGDRQMLVYNDLSETERVRLYDKGVASKGLDHTGAGSPRMSYRFGDTRSPYIEFHEPLLYQDQHFVNCVKNGTRPVTDGEAGRAVVAVLEAAQISLNEQRQVSIDEVGASYATSLSLTGT
jgi:predicted dehydrogenase